MTIMTTNDNELIVTTIEIDCAPMMPRPDKYFRHICSEILKCEYYDPFSKFFGNWEWNVKMTPEQEQKVKEYLTEIYNRGRIRYASW